MNLHSLLLLFIAWLISAPVLYWFARRQLTGWGTALILVAFAVLLYLSDVYFTFAFDVKNWDTTTRTLARFGLIGVALVMTAIFYRFRRKKILDVSEGPRS